LAKNRKAQGQYKTKGGFTVKKGFLVGTLAMFMLPMLVGSAVARDVIIGVSWSDFGQARWKTDEAAIKAELAKSGDIYISTDAQGSADKQLKDIDVLIGKGANVIMILAQDNESILPAVTRAKDSNVRVVSYDRLIEDPWAFYISFDNKEVGRLQAQMIYKTVKKGNFAFIKGSPTDPNADLLFQGQMEVLGKAIKSGAIKNVGEQYTESWKPEVAKRNMEEILVANENKITAVVASNDGTAGGAVAALTAVGLAGKIPVSGQDADLAALNRIARGTQTGTVWKDSRVLGTEAARLAVFLGNGMIVSKIPNSKPFNGGPKKVAVTAILLPPVVITKSNLDVIFKANWASKADVCAGTKGFTQPKACR
jgi:D-xylose transport system substrate-binding protein